MTTADRADLAALDDRSAAALRPEDEVARICADLIRIDSTNPGDGTGPGERAAAEYVMAQLAEVGLEGELLESAPGRANVVVRLEGADPGRPASRCTATSTSCRRTPPTGRSTPSRPRSATAASGAAAPST